MRNPPRAGVANRLLAALPTKDYQRLLAQLEQVDLTFPDVLYEPGERMRHVYFPNTSTISLLAPVDRTALEVGLIGSEGLVGIPLVLGSSVSTTRVVVQGTGTSMRMKSHRFREAFGQSLALQRLVYRYLNALITQISQTAACNGYHPIEPRLARWLLMSRDRSRTDELSLTQDFLAHMLGVRRVSVTNAARKLQKQGLVSYLRGHITIVDRAGLRAVACDCYRIVNQVYAALPG